MSLTIDQIANSNRPFNIEEWTQEIEAESRRNGENPVAALIRCSKGSDHNRTFDPWEPKERENLVCLARHFRVYSEIVPNGFDLRTSLNLVRAEGSRPIKCVVLSGHGSKTGVIFRRNYKYGTESDHQATFLSLLTPDADVISLGCSTAPLAQAISRTTQLSVYAPSAPGIAKFVQFKGRILPIYLNGSGHLIGKHYVRGKEVEMPPIDEVIHYIEERGANRDLGSAIFLMYYYRKQSWEHAKEWVKLAAELGDPEALLCFPKIQDRYLMPLAKCGHGGANYKLGLKCYNEKKYHEARRYLQTSAKRGNAKAQLLLAHPFCTDNQKELPRKTGC